MTGLALLPLPSAPDIVPPGPADWAEAILEFLHAEIGNDHTRLAYKEACRQFFHFARDQPGGDRIDTIGALHVSAWLRAMEQGGVAVPTVNRVLLPSAGSIKPYRAGDYFATIPPPLCAGLDTPSAGARPRC